MGKLRVGILFGGKSAEHEISLLSAKSIIDAIDRDKYEPVLIGIDKAGRWLLSRSSRLLLDSADPRFARLNPESEPVAVTPRSEGRLIGSDGGERTRIDVMFPVLHGPFGEDGTVQGLLKSADIPFVGAGVLASAAGMDKDVTKRLLRDAGIPVARFTACRRNTVPGYAEVIAALGTPVFVKPANLGSSVGIAKVKDAATYQRAVEDALAYDTKILIEEFITGREIECAVLGNEAPTASLPGEIIPSHEFYSYEAKYIDEHGAKLEIPARLPDQAVRRVQELAVKTFTTLGCEGMGRVDFFLRNTGDLLVNEINTIPGFTRISMYPRLWEASGIAYPELIDRLIRLALERFERERNLKTSQA
ncbi:MAG TPA: D-alanine--D-alanine ligase [Gammaproteobacteria bacterium]|nr:D-alanine--D-alanine ligase [Gammaproteobacteria bacterium]